MIIFLKKKLFLILTYQNNSKILKIINFKQKLKIKKKLFIPQKQRSLQVTHFIYFNHEEY